ncbi:hypothetical protein BgiBS90_027611, partial [Biomphalaria glabrata]
LEVHSWCTTETNTMFREIKVRSRESNQVFEYGSYKSNYIKYKYCEAKDSKEQNVDHLYNTAKSNVMYPEQLPIRSTETNVILNIKYLTGGRRDEHSLTAAPRVRFKVWVYQVQGQ